MMPIHADKVNGRAVVEGSYRELRGCSLPVWLRWEDNDDVVS